QSANGTDAIGRKVILSLGDSYREGRALSFFALNGNRTVMQLDQFLHQRESDSGSLVSSAFRSRYPVESLEYVRQFALGYPGASVTDLQPDGIAGGFNHDRDTAVEGKFEGVGDEIQDNLFPHIAIKKNCLVQRRTNHGVLQAGAVHGRTKP